MSGINYVNTFRMLKQRTRCVSRSDQPQFMLLADNGGGNGAYSMLLQAQRAVHVFVCIKTINNKHSNNDSRASSSSANHSGLWSRNTILFFVSACRRASRKIESVHCCAYTQSHTHTHTIRMRVRALKVLLLLPLTHSLHLVSECIAYLLMMCAFRRWAGGKHGRLQQRQQ